MRENIFIQLLFTITLFFILLLNITIIVSAIEEVSLIPFSENLSMNTSSENYNGNVNEVSLSGQFIDSILYPPSHSKSISKSPEIEWQQLIDNENVFVKFSIQEIPGGGYTVTRVNYVIDEISLQDSELPYLYISGNYDYYPKYYDRYPKYYDYYPRYYDFSPRYWVSMINISGIIEWNKEIPVPKNTIFHYFNTLSDGTVFIIAIPSGDEKLYRDRDSSYNHIITRFNLNGTPQWNWTLNTTPFNWIAKVVQTTDGGYIIIGMCPGPYICKSVVHCITYDIEILKISQDGIIEWQRFIDESEFDFINDIRQTTDGGYIAFGTVDSGQNDIRGLSIDNYLLVKISANGEIQWKKTFPHSFYKGSKSVQQTQDGGYIVFGTHISNYANKDHNSFDDIDCWAAKLFPDGNIEWEKFIGTPFNAKAINIQQTIDGGYIALGKKYVRDEESTENDTLGNYWIFKLSSNGELEWQKILGNSETDEPIQIQQTIDGSYIVIGSLYLYNYDNATYDGHCWIVKLGPDPK